MESFAKLERCQLTDARPLDDRLREMTSFGERQLSLERSQLCKILPFSRMTALGLKHGLMPQPDRPLIGR